MTSRVQQATADALGFWPAPGRSVAADALGMLVAHAEVLAHQYQHSKPVAFAQRSAFDARSVVNLTWFPAALLAVGPWFFSRIGWP